MRGPRYKGFAKGGSKAVFWLGHPPVTDRVVVTESAIDAMSLASIEDWPDGTLYISTGGGFGPQAEVALCTMLSQYAQIIAAPDQGIGGDMFASRLHGLARNAGNAFARLVPEAKDWNDQLRLRSS